MAPVSSDGRVRGERSGPVLSRTTLMSVRRMLHAYREGWLAEARLATAARMVAEDAHRHALPAERMLVVLKGEWGTLEAVRRLPVLDAQALLGRLVALAISAYYGADDRRERPAGGGRPAGPGESRRARDAA